MLELKLSLNNVLMTATCVFCGCEHDTDIVIVNLVVDGITQGTVCEECLLVGPVKSAIAMYEHADRIRKEAGYIEKDAEEVEKMTAGQWIDATFLRQEIEKVYADMPVIPVEEEFII